MGLLCFEEERDISRCEKHTTSIVVSGLDIQRSTVEKNMDGGDIGVSRMSLLYAMFMQQDDSNNRFQLSVDMNVLKENYPYVIGGKTRENYIC